MVKSVISCSQNARTVSDVNDTHILPKHESRQQRIKNVTKIISSVVKISIGCAYLVAPYCAPIIVCGCLFVIWCLLCAGSVAGSNNNNNRKGWYVIRTKQLLYLDLNSTIATITLRTSRRLVHLLPLLTCAPDQCSKPGTKDDTAGYISENKAQNLRYWNTYIRQWCLNCPQSDHNILQ